jgi:hypothetical protein
VLVKCHIVPVVRRVKKVCRSALELAGIADRYERQAIQEELARDQELAQLFASVIGKEIQAASRTEAPQGEK